MGGSGGTTHGIAIVLPHGIENARKARKGSMERTKIRQHCASQLRFVRDNCALTAIVSGECERVWSLPVSCADRVACNYPCQTAPSEQCDLYVCSSAFQYISFYR
jgi:hypothetical protein